jgi:hypothetical protein
MIKYKISSDFPIPPPTSKGHKRRYPLDKMEVGDSFLVPKAEERTIRNAVYLWASRHNKKFTIRTLDNGTIRCWRIK